MAYQHDTADMTTELEVSGHLFTYYPRVAGIVITRGCQLIDAGVIGAPGPISDRQLARYARGWLVYRANFLDVKYRHEMFLQATDPRTANGKSDR